ncbi:hypothetical protein NAB79_19025 [Proteus mirabilis]|nr:hypothetical protein [Proteus mirabilis]
MRRRRKEKEEKEKAEQAAKEEKERALSQTIRANAILNRKREKVNRKYTQNVDRGRQLSPGFLEEALDEDDEADYYETRRSRRNFEEELEVEARAEKRIMHAKRQQGHRDIPRKSSIPAVKPRRPVEFSESEREESEYETDGDEYERSPPHKRTEVEEPEYEDDEEEHMEDDAEVNAAYSEDEEPKPRGGSGSKRKGIESDEESPPRKAPTNQRRKAFVYDSDEE